MVMKSALRFRYRRRLIDFSFIAPCLIFFVFFVVVPFIQGFPLSFTNWNGISPTYEYIGFRNYVKLFNDERMIRSIQNTLFFSAGMVVFCNLIGLSCAMAIRRRCRFNSVIRTLIFMPFTVSLILASYMWRYVFNDFLYSSLNIVNPLTKADTVMIGITIIGIWRTSGYCMIVYIAALQGIPEDYYECARIEGASPWKVFLHITLPLIVPAITTNVTLLISWGMKVYDYPMAATGGGPGFSSMTLAMLVYHNLFQYSKAGYGQAIAIVFTAMVYLLSTLVTRSIRRLEVEL